MHPVHSCVPFYAAGSAITAYTAVAIRLGSAQYEVTISRRAATILPQSSVCSDFIQRKGQPD